MMSMNAYQNYRRTQVTTASQGELLLMLFEGAIKFAQQARLLIEERDFALANTKLQRTQDIVNELMASLNFDSGPLAQDLYRLYAYIHERLVEANTKKDTAQLDEALQLLVEFRDTWRQVVHSA